MGSNVKKLNIIDLHCDTILNCYPSGKDLHTLDGHINLEKLQAGGCLAQCFALFIPSHELAVHFLGKEYDTWEIYQNLLATYRRVMDDVSDVIRPAFCADDILENSRNGFMSSILTVEDAVELDGKMERLEQLYKDGVRMIALTWNFENSVGFPNSRDSEKHLTLGLKPFGIEVVERMNELGMIVDVSHLSEAGFYDIIKYSKKPFVASHSCCRALRDHPRDLTDDQLRALADKGGVVGINFADDFLTDRGERYTTIDDVVRHMLHIRNVAGIDALAFGSDFDGIGSTLEFKDYSGLPLILDALEPHLSGDEIDKVCHGNFLRVFEAQK
jgi:membrane dipeptidase